MSYITTGVSKTIENPTPSELYELLKNDFISMFFSDDTIMVSFNIYYNSFMGEITAEYFNGEEVELEITTSIGKVVELYRKYFYNFLNNEPNRESNYA